MTVTADGVFHLALWPYGRVILLLEHLKFLIMPLFVSQSEVYYTVNRLLTDLTAQQSSTTAQWDSKKTTLH